MIVANMEVVTPLVILRPLVARFGLETILIGTLIDGCVVPLIRLDGDLVAVAVFLDVVAGIETWEQGFKYLIGGLSI